MTAVVVAAWGALALVMAVLWRRQLTTRDATSVDAAWATGLALLALLYPWWVEGDLARRALVGAAGAIWGARLAWYLVTDRVIGHAQEDGRYRALRAHWGESASARFFVVYQAQAAVAVLFSLPMLAAMRGGALGALDVAGAVVWAIAVVGETVADRQLARFRADPANRGQVMRRGLWKYSRHPNYFFEWTHWWAYVLIGRGAPLTWIGPVLMLAFLFRVSGIPYTELQALKSRGDGYRAYQRTTNAFFPWFPRGQA